MVQVAGRMSLDETHARFQRNLVKSDLSVRFFANILRLKGYQVRVPDLVVSPTPGEHKEYADTGDLFVDHPGYGVLRIEVKHLKVQFTSALDWPYSPKFIVCGRDSWDRASEKPFSYNILNRDKTHVAIVRGKTSSAWYVEKRPDERYGSTYWQEFYFCPMEAVRFSEL